MPAFPGAEGFGAASVGGRGGDVYHVTTLEPTGPGSINEATQASGPRTIVFDVSGVIRGDVLIKDGNLTIAGQTAPGAGITIEGRLKSLYSNWSLPEDDPGRHMYHDLILRHIRIRPPEPGGIDGDCIQLTDWDRVILDHVSVAWGNDENIDLSASRDVTVQWSTIEESDNHYWPEGDPRHAEGTHNYGMITGYAGRNISIHHNLFAHHKMRTPLNGAEPLDHRNNVIYDVDQGLSFHPPRLNYSRPGQPIAANVVGNYWAEGPSALKNGIDTYVPPGIDGKYSWLYAAQNYFDYLNYGEGGYLDLEDYHGVSWLDKSQVGTYSYPAITAQEPFLTAPADPTVVIPRVVTQDAREAYDLVLEYAGSFPHDAVTARTIQEVQTKTGSFGKHLPEGGLLEGLTAGKAPLDTDRDGMPDAWENAHGLDGNDPSDRNGLVPLSASRRNAGYTWLEFYLNELSDGLTGMDQLQYPGIQLVPSSARPRVAEGGATDSYQVALMTQPSTNVTIQLEADAQLQTSATTLVFTPDNWEIPQTVTVSAIDDEAIEGPHSGQVVHRAASDDPAYSGLVAVHVSGVTDNDVPGIFVQTGEMVTSEGGRSASFTVVLNSRPAFDVAVHLVSSDSSEGMVSPEQLVFTAADWSTPQTVTVTGVDDPIADGDVEYAIHATVASEDPAYASQTIPDIPVVNRDSEIAIVADNADAGFGREGDWIFHQTTTPFYYRNSAFYSWPGTGADKARWTFADLEPGTYRVSATWGGAYSNRATDAPYTIYDGETALETVRVNQRVAADDFEYDQTAWEVLGDFTINGTTLMVQLSDQANYVVVADAIHIEKVGLPAPLPGVLILQTNGATSVAEGGAADDYEIVLQAAPTAEVTIGLDPKDQLLVEPAAVTFTPTNWDMPQRVTVTAVDDGLVEELHSGTIVHRVSSSDHRYDGIAVENLVVAVADNDQPVMAPLILDNTAPAFTTVGTWRTDKSVPWYGGVAHYSWGGNGANQARWTFENLEPGQYRISATWQPRYNGATNAPFTIYDGQTALDTVRVNQRVAADDFQYNQVGWEVLGEFTISGSTLVVQLSDQADWIVFADAILIEKIPSP